MRNGPDSAAITGTFDTSDTAGYDAPHAHIEGVSPVFDIARAHELTWALRALDPADTAASPNMCQTSPGLTVNRGDPAADASRVQLARDDAVAKLHEMGYTLDEKRGLVLPYQAPGAWMSQGAGVGTPVVVPEQKEGAAG
jgi:hypothetical protein